MPWFVNAAVLWSTAQAEALLCETKRRQAEDPQLLATYQVKDTAPRLVNDMIIKCFRRCAVHGAYHLRCKHMS